MPARVKKQRLNIFLLKPGTDDYLTVLKAPDRLRRVDLHPDLTFPGAIYIRRSHSTRPRWLPFVEAGSAQPLEDVFNASSSALVMVEVRNRLFAVSFGHARHWLQDDVIVRRFGLITTLNAVDPEKIKSVDAQNFDALTVSTTTQTSRIASLDTFGLDLARDVMRAVTGIPRDATFADRLTGRDALVLNVRLQFKDLSRKLTEAFDIYEMDTYKYNFPWIDNFKKVNDPELIADLDQRLMRAISASEVETIYLAPPRSLDFDDLEGYRYSPFENEQADLHIDLDIGDFLTWIDDPSELTVDELRKSLRIHVYMTGLDTPWDTFPVYDAIVFETLEANRLFILSYGEWFEVERSYVQRVERELANILDDQELELPDAYTHEKEKDYNIRASEMSNGVLALLDRRHIMYGGGLSRMELCDLLATDKKFVHVKKKTESASLSHLFSQGLNSAQAFLFDQAFRNKAREICPESHKHLLPEVPITASQYTVVYCIIMRSSRELKESLPFLSKQSLVNAAKDLTALQYRVFIRKVSTEHA